MAKNGKPWWTSRTLWVNALAGIVLIANSQLDIADITSGETGAVLVVANLVLRLVTSDRLTIS